jgi:hypothetical protein
MVERIINMTIKEHIRWINALYGVQRARIDPNTIYVDTDSIKLQKKGKTMAELLGLLLLVIFLSALSGFWLGYFLAKTITINQMSDKLDTLITETLDEQYHDDNSDIVKNLTELIHNLSLDKTDYSAYNESIAHKYKHEHHKIESEVNTDYEVRCID